MTRVLVVEDEESFSDALSYMLEREGFEAVVAATGPDALAEFDRGGADVVLLDLMLPGLPGTEVCRALRSRSSVPIIMLTAKDSEIDKVVGLELGADDYVTKPYSARELVARIRAVLRRVRPQPQPLLVAGGVTVDRPTRTVRVAGRRVDLSAKEYELLLELASDPERVFTRSELLQTVWRYPASCRTRTIDSHASRLRRKLEEGGAGPFVVNVWGVGYRLLEP